MGRIYWGNKAKGFGIKAVSALLAAGLLAACTGQRPVSSTSSAQNEEDNLPVSTVRNDASGQPTETAALVYYIPLPGEGGQGVVVNGEGRELLRGKNLTVLYDVETGLPQAIEERFPLHEAMEGDRTDQVLYEDCEAMLYGLDGEVLQPHGPGVYRPGIGRYVVHASREVPYYEVGPVETEAGFRSTLINMETGETVLENAYQLFVLQEGSLGVMGGNHLLQGVVDMSLSPLHGFPMEQNYAFLYPWGEGYLATVVDGEFQDTGYVLDASFQILASYPGTRMTKELGRGDGCITLDIWGGEGIPQQELVDAITGEPVLDLAALGLRRVPYYDGEILVGVENDDSGQAYGLYRADGSLIAGQFYDLQPKGFLFAPQAEQFYACKDDAQLQLLNGQGEVLAQTACTPGTLYQFGPQAQFPAAKTLVAVQQEGKGVALFSEDLRELVPAGKYGEIFPLSPVDSSLPRYLQALYGSQTGGQQSDILDMEGKLVVSGLDVVYPGSGAGERFVVEKNGDVGLIDAAGNWLYRVP